MGLRKVNQFNKGDSAHKWQISNCFCTWLYLLKARQAEHRPQGCQTLPSRPPSRTCVPSQEGSSFSAPWAPSPGPHTIHIFCSCQDLAPVARCVLNPVTISWTTSAPGPRLLSAFATSRHRDPANEPWHPSAPSLPPAPPAPPATRPSRCTPR